MAISQEHVKELQRITADLGDLLLSIHPVTIKEWDVFDGAVTAHKHLRKLDTDSLLQLELPIPGKNSAAPSPHPDCPRCQGTGKYRDPASSENTDRPCPCAYADNSTWPLTKKEWEDALAPVED